MKVWSKGLEKIESSADCRYYKVSQDSDGKNVFVIGNITDPVNREYKAMVEPEDTHWGAGDLLEPILLSMALELNNPRH